MGKLDLNGSSGSSSQSTQVMNLKCAMMRGAATHTRQVVGEMGLDGTNSPCRLRSDA